MREWCCNDRDQPQGMTTELHPPESISRYKDVREIDASEGIEDGSF
jgi:hypothetical protein